MNLMTLVKEGGFIMYPLLLCSIAIWAVIFEKFWELARFKREYRRLYFEAGKLIQEKKIEEARGLYRSASDLVGAPYLALFEEGFSSPIRDERIARRLQETQLGLKRFLWVLGTVSSAAPFIGLFGTVVGIIRSFDSMAETNKSGFAVVASGLSEALMATAAGILVAVVAVIFYNYFQTRLQKVNLEFRNKLQDLADLLRMDGSV